MRKWLAVAWVLMLVGIVCVIHDAKAQNKLLLLYVGSGATTCAQGTTVVNRLDGTQSAGVSQAYQNFVCGLITDGLASGDFTATCGSIIDDIGIWWSNNQLNSGIKICNTTYTQSNINSPLFTNFMGWSGNSSVGSYLDSGYNPSIAGANLSTTSAHISCFMVAGTGPESQPCMAQLNLTGLNIYPRFTGPNPYFRIVDNPESGAQTDQGTQVGFWLANRTDATHSTGTYCTGSSCTAPTFTINETNGTLKNGDITLISAVTSVAGNSGIMGAYTIGGQLSNTQIQNLYLRLHNFCHDSNINAC